MLFTQFDQFIYREGLKVCLFDFYFFKLVEWTHCRLIIDFYFAAEFIVSDYVALFIHFATLMVNEKFYFRKLNHFKVRLRCKDWLCPCFFYGFLTS